MEPPYNRRNSSVASLSAATKCAFASASRPSRPSISPAVMIDFRDVPEFLTFVLPDTLHIDGTDVPRYTAVFANLLKARGLAR